MASLFRTFVDNHIEVRLRRNLLFGFVVLGTFTALHTFCLYTFKAELPDIIDPLKRADNIRAVQIQSQAGSSQEAEHLWRQYWMLDLYKQHHLHVATVFDRNYYACSWTIALGTILASICALLIAKKGWDGTLDNIKVIFLSSSFAATLALSITQVYDTKLNVANNLSAYFGMEKEQIRIHRAMFACGGIGSDSARFVLCKRIGEVDEFMINSRNIFASFNPSNLPELVSAGSLKEGGGTGE